MKKLIFFTLIIVILGTFYLYTEIYTRGVTNMPVQQGTDVLKKPTPAEVTNTSDSPGQEAVGNVPKDDTVAEKESTTTYDWRNDEIPDKRPPHKDPFGDFIAEQHAKEQGTWIGDPETTDPDELNSAVYNQHLKRFGDIPEVHTYMEYIQNASKNVPLTIDEEIAGLEATNKLFPSGSTRRTLAFYEWMRTNGGYNAFQQGIPIKELQDLGIKVEINETDGGYGVFISTK